MDCKPRASLERIFFAALILLGALTAPPTQAASVTMKVEPHYGGHFKFGEWLPLRVTLANDGPALRAEVRADTTAAGGRTTYAAPVELATGARKRLILYVQPASFARAIRVRLMDGTRELDSQTVDVIVERNVTYLVGVITARTQSFTILNSLTLNGTSNVGFKGPPQFARPVKIIPISLGEIPDRPEGLWALDAIVISGVDTSELTAEQRRALQTWVERGGRLILGGGASAARTLTGLPDDLSKDFRATSSTADLQSLSALDKFAGQQVRVPGPFPVTWPSDGRTLIEQDNRALLVEKRVGDGHVNYSALDLASSPFDAWAGALRFWEKLLTPGSAYPAGAPPDVSPRAARASNSAYALQNMPALELPSMGWLTGLLAIYILLVGPVNYLVLRRWRKLAWGWITIPALTLAFSAGAFASAYSMRGGDVIIHKISIMNLGAAGPMQTYVGIFSPERTTYTIRLPGRTLVAPINLEGNPFGGASSINYSGAEIVEGEPVQVRGVQVNQWAMQAFVTESPLPEGWRIESNVTLEGDRVRGTLVNRTPESMADAVLFIGSRYARLGDLASGQSRALDESLQNGAGQPFPYFLFENAFRVPGPTGPSTESQLRSQLLSSYYQSYGGPAQPPSRPTLIGWIRASPLDVQVADARWATRQTSLLVATLNMQYVGGAIHLPPGSIPVTSLVDRQGESGTCGPYANQVYVANGSVTMEFQLPEELSAMSITRLDLVISGGALPTVTIADRNGDWLELDSPTQARNKLTNPARFVSADGVVRVRISAAAAQGTGCAIYDLDLEGEVKRKE